MYLISPQRTNNPTRLFSILEPYNQEIGYFCSEGALCDGFRSSETVKGSVGKCELTRKRKQVCLKIEISAAKKAWNKTSPFTVIAPQNQFPIVQVRRATDYKAPKIVKGLLGK